MAVIVIALGVALAAGVLLANRSAARPLRRVRSTRWPALPTCRSPPVSGGTFDASVLDEVRAVAGVKAAAPLLLAGRRSSGATDGVTRLRSIGVDLLDDATVRVYRRPGGGTALEDPLVFLNQQDSVLLPRALATRLGIAVGGAFDVEDRRSGATGSWRAACSTTAGPSTSAGNLLVMDLGTQRRRRLAPTRA